MEKRIGTISIVIYNTLSVKEVNLTLSSYSNYILSRNGLPLKDKGINIITIIIETTTNNINALTGKLGKIRDVEVKCLLCKYKEEENI